MLYLIDIPNVLGGVMYLLKPIDKLYIGIRILKRWWSRLVTGLYYSPLREYHDINHCKWDKNQNLTNITTLKRWWCWDILYEEEQVVNWLISNSQKWFDMYLNIYQSSGRPYFKCVNLWSINFY